MLDKYMNEIAQLAEKTAEATEKKGYFDYILAQGKLLYKLFDWLGNHYFIALAAVIHLVFLSAFFWVVISEEIEAEKVPPMVTIDVSILRERGKDTREKEGGKNNFPDLTKFRDPGHEKEAKAKKADAKPTFSPKTTENREFKGLEGSSTLAPVNSNALGNLLDGTSQESGSSDEGKGDVPAGYGLRGEGNKGAGLMKFGGGKNTEDAVELGLLWLRNHLHIEDYLDKKRNTIEIGWWNPSSFHKDARNNNGYPDQSNMGDSAASRNDDYRVGVTSLALLAFLGAGNTTKNGKYSDVVIRVINYLLLQQERNGSIGGRNNYNHIMATEALAEALILTKDKRLRKPLEKAVKVLLDAQNLGGGWDYTPIKTVHIQRNDSSITSLALIALKSADYAGVEIPRSAYLKMIYHFQRMTDTDNFLFYGDKSKITDRRKGAGMLATNIFSRLILGQDKNSNAIKSQVQLLMHYLPDTKKVKSQEMSTDQSLNHSYYSWYLGTLACFFHGGDVWTRWNTASKPAILSQQIVEKHSHSLGSFRTADMWSFAAGKIYSTSINVLSLEIYYRYMPAFFLTDSKDLRIYWEDKELLYFALGEEGKKMRLIPLPHR